jgi:hypothetical protein
MHWAWLVTEAGVGKLTFADDSQLDSGPRFSHKICVIGVLSQLLMKRRRDL